MIEIHDVAATVVVCGGVAALTFRNARGVAGGLFVVMAVSPLAVSPTPGALTLVLRGVGALLAAYLLWTAARDRAVTGEGSAIGIPAVVALAAAAFCVGWLATPVAPLAGSHAAQAAGVSLAAMAVVPLAGRDPLRAGTAVVGLVVAASLLLGAWVGPGSPLAQLIWTGLLVGATGAASLLIWPVAETVDEAPMAIPVAAPMPGAVASAAETAAATDAGTEADEAPEATPEPTNSVELGGKTQRVIGAREGRLRPRGDR
jgi:hypothetical protein